MDSAKSLAKRMLKSLDVGDSGFLASVAQGMLSFPVSMYYLGYDFMDTTHRHSNFDDRVRMANMLKRGISVHQEAQKIVNAVIREFMSKVNIDSIQGMAQNFTGVMAGKFIFAELTGVKLGAAVSTRIMTSFAAGVVIGSALTIGAETSRAIYTARKLENQNPALYYRLKSMGDLDLLYFLVEDKLKPFLDACSVADVNKHEFNEVCKYFFGGL
ncbi:TPA: hypothetical protein O8U57_004163 [Enterobacter asburiae]|uniref:hypothetical protein n=1 Tax=Enterobacter cloacae complex TaxID=354276 RepID=UPI0007B32C39|nr:MULTISPECIES: hypothetical protein [Enterobacter cloacae complex]ASD59724.1 hypothetical protein WM95_14620 [Enterobacter cloacae complex sp. ECNIH7]KZP93936.1 hypothetical protein A3N46_17530 [Enterobacter asburiae]POV42812.1 hypothetical protein C3394_05500 [Enterobacter cloacae complex sp. ECNIH11]POV46357.1 hypothetical protein C3397_05410 [Enterobacter cloacae complex sp. ECNIH16]HBM7600444.1 hypothetical protein [Enterobacter asburiae]